MSWCYHTQVITLVEGTYMLSPLDRYVLVVAGCLLICLLASTPPLFAQNTTIDSFNHAKKLLTQVFAGHETTFYYGCAYTGKKPPCGVSPK